MDKNTILGLVLVGAILFGFTWYNSNQQKKFVEQQMIADSIERVQHPEKFAAELPQTDSAAMARAAEIEAERNAAAEANQQARTENLGQALVDAATGEEKIYTLENSVMKVYVSSLGGVVENVELKDYKRYDGKPLMLFADSSARFDMSFYLRRTYNYAQVNTDKLYFTSSNAETIDVTGAKQGQSLSLRVAVDDGAYIEYIYTIRPDDYMIDFDVRFEGMRDMLSNLTDFSFDWGATSLQNEKGYKNENMYTTICYRYPDTKKTEELGMAEAKRGGGIKSEDVTSQVNWFDFKQQFFSSAFIAKDNFLNAYLKYSTYPEGSGKLKDFEAKVSVPFSPSQSQYDFQFYFGPNKFSVLKTYDLSLERVVPLGGKWVRWVNQWFVIPVFDYLGSKIVNFGIIILILTFIIKLIISPLTFKSYMSSAKMRVLKPEIDEINAKYPRQEDAMKKQQETMDLYKRAGVSPMGGCLPMLIQFPIIVAMFRFFPASIELRGERFLWADDLSAYDSVLNLPFNIPWYGDHVSLFALLMAAALMIYSKISYDQTSSAGPQMAGMKFMMVYMMPVMMLFWFNSYASGLCYYYLISQLFTIAQQTGFRYFVNEDKLHQRLQNNAKAPKKKSKFQQRYEEMMRQQQSQQAVNRQDRRSSNRR